MPKQTRSLRASSVSSIWVYGGIGVFSVNGVEVEVGGVEPRFTLASAEAKMWRRDRPAWVMSRLQVAKLALA